MIEINPEEQNEKQAAVVPSPFISIFAGVPSACDLISIYCRCRGIPSPLPQLNFYLALSIFKLAGIAQVRAKLRCVFHDITP